VLIYDVENTMFKHQKGEVNPSKRIGSAFCKPQFLVMSGFKWLNEPGVSFGNNGIRQITQEFFNEATLIVGQNLKHDLHWARRTKVDISKVVVWDTQLAGFLLNKQTPRYPSLNLLCERYGFPPKIDIIERDYWSKGIDTDEIPTDVLSYYLVDGDLDRTERVFKEQIKQFKGIDL